MDLTKLLRESSTKILLIVIDGLGGFADAEHGTELEEADTPHLDRLAAEGILGLLEPVGPGITPGSGPGHLALFGYDPIEHLLGRGALAAAGIGVRLADGDVAARGNLCRLDDDGTIADRRAGRIDDGPARELVRRAAERIDVDGVEVEIHHVKQHRVLVVLRGDLDPRVADTDPHRTGTVPHDPVAQVPEAEPTAAAIRKVIAQIGDALAGEEANGILLRGFEGHRTLPSMTDRYGLHPAAVAGYPMYRGVADLVGMDVLRVPTSLDDACSVVEEAWAEHDFVFLHHKDADRAGEDGDRSAKQAAIAAVDAVLPRLRDLGPSVIAVSGDHSTPSQLSAHSWHPVPTLVWNGRERDEHTRFGERWCRTGALGRRPTTEMMPLLLAMAGRLDKFGA